MSGKERGASGQRAHAKRAFLTWAALETLRQRRSGLYLEPARGGRLNNLLPSKARASSIWPFANAWAATLAISTLSGAPDEPHVASVLAGNLEAIAAYADRHGKPRALCSSGPLRLTAGAWQPPGAGGEAYYDDNAWIALDLLAQHQLSGGDRAIVLARRVLDFVLSGWSCEPSWAHPGGIRWAEPDWSTSRNTCSNGPAAEACALLGRADGDGALLERAAAGLEWLDRCLRSPEGLYADRIDPDGTVHGELYSYNQGTPIGAAVLCFETSKDRRLLDGAVTTSRACVNWLASSDILARQPPEFNAIYLRNILRLGRHADVSANLEQVSEWASWAWDRRRDHSTGLFTTGKPSVNDTAGMAAVYALLAGAEPVP